MSEASFDLGIPDFIFDRFGLIKSNNFEQTRVNTIEGLKAHRISGSNYINSFGLFSNGRAPQLEPAGSPYALEKEGRRTFVRRQAINPQTV